MQGQVGACARSIWLGPRASGLRRSNSSNSRIRWQNLMPLSSDWWIVCPRWERPHGPLLVLWWTTRQPPKQGQRQCGVIEGHEFGRKWPTSFKDKACNIYYSEKDPGDSTQISTFGSPGTESALASNAKEKQVQDSIQSYHVLIQRPFEEFTIFGIKMFGKVVLTSPRSSLEFKGEEIHRPQSFALRIGDEVFVSSMKRISAKEKNIYCFWFFNLWCKSLWTNLGGACGSDGTSSFRWTGECFQSRNTMCCWHCSWKQGYWFEYFRCKWSWAFVSSVVTKLILSPAKNPLSSLDFIKAATPTPNNPTARPKRKNWGCIIKKEVSAPIAQEEKPHALKITPRTLLPQTETLEFRWAPSIPSYIQIISASFSSSEVLKPVLRVPMILLQAHDLFLSKKFYV